MMGVYIKGMKMPKNCIDCAFGWNGWCHRINSRAFVEVDMRRHDCPLIEIPPHGRLIDADALRQTMYHEAFETDSPMQKWDSGCWIRYKMFENAEETAPTIIPTDKDNDVLGKEEGE